MAWLESQILVRSLLLTMHAGMLTHTQSLSLSAGTEDILSKIRYSSSSCQPYLDYNSFFVRTCVSVCLHCVCVYACVSCRISTTVFDAVQQLAVCCPLYGLPLKAFCSLLERELLSCGPVTKEEFAMTPLLQRKLLDRLRNFFQSTLPPQDALLLLLLMVANQLKDNAEVSDEEWRAFVCGHGPNSLLENAHQQDGCPGWISRDVGVLKNTGLGIRCGVRVISLSWLQDLDYHVLLDISWLSQIIR